MDPEPIPQVELHCHLIGVIDAAMLRRVRAGGHEILIEPDAVMPAASVSSAQTFLAWIDSLGPYRFADWRVYAPILSLHLDDLVAQHVVDTEITISLTMFSKADDDACLTDIAAFVAAARRAAAGRIDVRFLVIIPRRLPTEVMERDTRVLIAAHRAGLVAGVAVAGMDYDLGLARLWPMLRRLKDAGLGIEIHTGEHTGPDEVAAVLDTGLAGRIGHGIRAFEDPRLVERLAREQVHLEICPSSNLRTAVVATLDDLPIGKARAAGLNFSINTDDPGAFGCTMVSEMQIAVDHFGFTPADLAMLAANAMRSRFV